jgi:hypothetical protein
VKDPFGVTWAFGTTLACASRLFPVRERRARVLVPAAQKVQVDQRTRVRGVFERLLV